MTAPMLAAHSLGFGYGAKVVGRGVDLEVRPSTRGAGLPGDPPPSCSPGFIFCQADEPGVYTCCDPKNQICSDTCNDDGE